MLLHRKKEDLGVDRVLFDAVVHGAAIPALSTFFNFQMRIHHVPVWEVDQMDTLNRKVIGCECMDWNCMAHDHI